MTNSIPSSKSPQEPSTTAYWHKNPADLFVDLQSAPEGLSQAAAKKILDRVGPNSLEAHKKRTAFGLFLNQFKSPIVLIILIIILGSTLLSFFQEYNASNAAEQLKKRISLKTKVLRGGKEVSIPAEEVVPGDVVLLSAGSLVPADGVLLAAKDFFVNQAVLTGETFPVEKFPGVDR